MAAFMGAATLVSSSVTSDQQIYAYTSSGTNLTIKFIAIGSAFTVYSATESYLGFARTQYNISSSGWVTKDRSPAFVNTDLDNNCSLIIRPLGTGQVLVVGDSIRGICTPATATSIRWNMSVWGDTA